MRNLLFAAIVASVPLARAHIAFYDPSMWGYNVTMQTFSYDNRPMAPLQQYTFDQWWFHGHLGYPPNAGDFFELPAGGVANSQLACNKGATKWWATSEGTTDIRQGEYPCPGYPTSQFHGIDDVKGCALSIAYTSDVNSIQPQDLAVFSVNQQCVWNVDTGFQIPKDMPPCPDGGCICAWHWIHSVDSGSAQMFMNGFRCQVTGSTANTPIGTPQVPKRCTNDPSQCYTGPQQPLYWYQAEGNNIFTGQYDPPHYLDEWGFFDGAQNGIFGNGGNSSPSSSSSSPSSSSSSSPTSTPTPATPADNQPPTSPTPTPTPSSPSNGNNLSGNTPPQINNLPQGNGGNGGDPSSSSSSSVPPQSSPPPSPPANNNNNDPAPSPSPSPSPSSPPPDNSVNNPPPSNPQGNGNSDSEINPANNQPPSPSGTPRCKPRNGNGSKKRQMVASRHFRNKRHHARDHHH
ncbi:hypothetical protein BJ322DRAFT_409934 [Thelephora terrestris]|uniref:Uncharacterized protein n=1 Tax=Thelephora terrestris TaxID=56493 RepID=A0A9P6LB00_9AGAM|nr:hypothetical protein BJ322DRAFT_409934 [Thelephora terrestris]